MSSAPAILHADGATMIRPILTSILLFTASTALAGTADRDCTRERVPARFFAPPPPAQVRDESPGRFEVVVVRLADDGTLVAGCFDDEAAAKRFLEAPKTEIPSRTPVQR